MNVQDILNENDFRQPVARKVISISLMTFLTEYLLISILLCSKGNVYMALVETSTVLSSYAIYVFFWGAHSAFNRLQARKFTTQLLPLGVSVFLVACGGAWIWLNYSRIVFIDTVMAFITVSVLVYALFHKQIRYHLYRREVLSSAEMALK